MLLPVVATAQYWRATLYLGSDPLESKELAKDLLPVDLEQLYQVSSINGIPSRIEILQLSDTYYAWEDCNLNVYRWKDNQWINTYKYNNYGYFCDGYPLEWNRTLYLLGGNGLVNYHSDLLIFDESLGSWEFVSAKSQPLDYNTPFVGLVENGAFSLFGKKVNLRNGLEEPVKNGYFLDLNELSWFELHFDFVSSDQESYLSELDSIGIDTKDYLLVKSKNGWLIFDKSTYNLSHLGQELIPVSPPLFSKVQENKITWKTKEGIVHHLDVASVVPKAKLLAKGEVTPVKKEKVKSLRLQNSLIITFFLGLVILVLTRFYLRSKRKISDSVQQDETSQEEEVVLEEEKNGSDLMWNKIMLADRQIFSTAELDEFFEIQNVSPENRKARRSRIIKAYNERALSEFGKEIILRERDPLDKRFFRFRIQIK
jgi:hypothetical protein